MLKKYCCILLKSNLIEDILLSWKMELLMDKMQTIYKRNFTIRNKMKQNVI